MDNIKEQDEQIEVEAGSTARMIKQVKRHTKKRYTAEEKIRIVLEGFRNPLYMQAAFYGCLHTPSASGRCWQQNPTSGTIPSNVH